MQKKGKSIGWMIKTCPQISAPKLKIFTYSESASHFRLNGVKISLLMAVFFVLLLLLLLTFFITHPILFLFSPFFCFLAHFLLFFALWVIPLDSALNSTSETPLILVYSFGWVCFFLGFSSSWAILNLVFWAYFFIKPIFKAGSSTIGFGTGFYVWFTSNIAWFEQTNMFFFLFLLIFSSFWMFFWVRFLLDHSSASGVAPLDSAQNFTSDTPKILVN